ncbi:YbjN domain-containing protein [Tumidithrix elongata RA019]|uniref:YbjN domain-containing protein n=1 Tax=Tumidithrix elongata BACA0141 TaxID=2716417 RepID=A0AAW9PZL7_9CYAN|nr:YbjN domain-containing protein [Tumidithrix elongata RA019]
MKFATIAQKVCYEKIKPWLHEMYENLAIPPYDLPIFILPMGSATAMVEVLPWGNSEAIIATWSYVVTGAELTADLMRFLLKQNSELQFGVFSVDDDGDIRFHSTLVGSTCDRKELHTSVSSVLETADRYDDEIVETWGGERALDRMY